MDIDKPNQPFEIIGKIIPVFIEGVWSSKKPLNGQNPKICLD